MEEEERVTYIYPGRPPFSSSALYDSLPPSSISNISSAFSGVRKREREREEGREKEGTVAVAASSSHPIVIQCRGRKEV